MKRTGMVVGTVALMGLSGCATQGFVRTQVDPLTERVGKLEAKDAELSSMREADTAATRQANDKAQQALELANKTAGDVVNAANDAKRAEAVALRAEEAALKAERAANEAARAASEATQAANEARHMATKSEKIFKLGQKK